jgi:hydroxyacylglutathione hydrolase
VVALPAFADNDIWLLHDGTQAVVVDTGDAKPAEQALERLRLNVAGILGNLCTTPRGDSVGSVDVLPALQQWKNESR